MNVFFYQISEIAPEISECSRLKTLRLEENCLDLHSIPKELVKDSQVSLLCLEGNLFNMKQFEDSDGYTEVITKALIHISMLKLNSRRLFLIFYQYDHHFLTYFFLIYINEFD